MGRRASTRRDYGGLREACSVIMESVPSSVTDIVSLAIRSVELMSRASTLNVCIGALESTLYSTNNTRIGKLELRVASKNLEFGEAMAELESTTRRLCFAASAVSLMQELVQSQWPHLRELEAACLAAKVARAAEESNVQSLAASDSVFLSKVCQFI